MVSVWKAFSVPVSSSLFLPFSSLMFIAFGLCWGLWYIWNWVLCKMIKMDLFPFHYMQLFILTNTICWRCSLCSNVYLWLLYKKIRCPYLCEFMSGSSIPFINERQQKHLPPLNHLYRPRIYFSISVYLQGAFYILNLCNFYVIYPSQYKDGVWNFFQEVVRNM